MTSNFVCKTCENDFYEPSFSVSMGSKQEYRKGGKLLQCPECKSVNVDYIPQKDLDPASVHFGKFGSLSDNDKKRVLKKRAMRSAKKNEERSQHLNKNFMGRGNHLDY